MRYRAPSIKEAGGLRVWLDGKKELHNGKGYDVFVALYTAGIKPTTIAHAFGKKRAWAVKNWIRVYEEEQQ